MAKPTSARDRSKRRASRRPTSSATRAARSRSSTNSSRVTQSGQGGSGSAQVTNAARRTSTGSAPVTSSTRPSLPPASSPRAALPPAGQTGGSQPPRGTTRPGTTRSGPTRFEQAQSKLRVATQGSSPSAVRTGQPGATNFRAPGFANLGAGFILNEIANRLLTPLAERGGRELRRYLERTINKRQVPDEEGFIRAPDGSYVYAGPAGRAGTTPLEAKSAATRQKPKTGTVQEDVSQQQLQIQSRGGGDRGTDAPRRMVTPNTPEAKKKSINQMYAEARKKALAIKDPTQRQAALEGVSQMGMELHREYFNKRPLTDL